MFGQPKRFVEVHREGCAGGGLRMVMDAETGAHGHHPAAGRYRKTGDQPGRIKGGQL